MDDDAPTTPPAPEQPAETPAPQPQQPETDWKAEAEKWKSHARKHEQLWKRRKRRQRSSRSSRPPALRHRKGRQEAEARGRADATKTYAERSQPQDSRLRSQESSPTPRQSSRTSTSPATSPTPETSTQRRSQRHARSSQRSSGARRSRRLPPCTKADKASPHQASSLEADLAHMNPDDINKAIAEGRLDEVRGIKTY